MRRAVATVIGVFLVLSGFLVFREWSLEPDGSMRVVFLDVGQGDSALITFRGGERLLIDGGPDWSTLEALGKRLPFFDRKIDMVLLSHPNSDHMTALPEVLRRYNVTTLLTAGTSYPSDQYAAVVSRALQKGVARTELRAGDTMQIGSATITVLWPPAIRPRGMDADANNDSLILRLEEGGKRILFTGDEEAIVEKTLLAAGVDLRADILKVAHHGSKSSSLEVFLKAVQPSLAVISVGRNNTYGHPSLSVLERLQALNIETRRTDREGDIELVW